VGCLHLRISKRGGYNAPVSRARIGAGGGEGRVARAGKASDSDAVRGGFQAGARLGLNAFRLGIEWSRIQPAYKDGKAPPPFDMKALEHYARILVACREQELEPC